MDLSFFQRGVGDDAAVHESFVGRLDELVGDSATGMELLLPDGQPADSAFTRSIAITILEHLPRTWIIQRR